MTDISTTFAGIPLDGPVIAASGPPTENLRSALACAESGAGAIITKSAAPITQAERQGGRRALRTHRGLWAQGSFGYETHTLDEAAELVASITRESPVPVIASVGSTTLSPTEIVSSCQVLQQAGARGIQIDLFYVPQPRVSSLNIARVNDLLLAAKEAVSVPVIPKLNIDYPAAFCVEWLRPLHVAGILLLDSVRTPAPFDLATPQETLIPNLRGAKECSLFGGWQLPITRQYTAVLAREGLGPICAGGGIWTGSDCLELMMLGASAVQVCSAIVERGAKHIRTLNRQVRESLERAGVDSLRGVIGVAPGNAYSAEEYPLVRARVDPSVCTGCGRCLEIAFCDDIRGEGGRVRILDGCIGCGYCQQVCPFPGAIVMEDAS